MKLRPDRQPRTGSDNSPAPNDSCSWRFEVNMKGSVGGRGQRYWISTTLPSSKVIMYFLPLSPL